MGFGSVSRGPFLKMFAQMFAHFVQTLSKQIGHFKTFQDILGHFLRVLIQKRVLNIG